MLLEALTWLTTPSAAWARSLGYLSAAIAFEARVRRCRQQWSEHIATCHRLICDAAGACPRHQRAVVLGSGVLVEVPLAALAQRFESVTLVDAVHLPAVRRRAACFPNVTLEVAELSGCALALAALRRRAGRRSEAGGMPGSLPAPIPPPLTHAGERFDLAVSANLLSQLPLRPLALLDGILPPAPDDDETALAYARAIIGAHLAWLPTVAYSVCLFTDIVEVTTAAESACAPSGRVLQRVDALYGYRLPEAEQSWVWPLAPAPELGRRTSQHNLMSGWRDAGCLFAGQLSQSAS